MVIIDHRLTWGFTSMQRQKTEQVKEQTPDVQRTQWPERMRRRLAADYLGVKPHTLAVWATTGRYRLPFIKVGSIVYYSKSALDTFLANRTVGSAGEEVGDV